MFEVGDKVVCVDDTPAPPREWKFQGSLHIVKGQVYVIRGFIVHRNGLGIYLLGIFGGVTLGYDHEVGWGAYRFRKLSDMQQEARERKSKEKTHARHTTAQA